MSVPAGWYPDPETPRQQRYWDGSQWTAQTAAEGQEPTVELPVPVPAPPPPPPGTVRSGAATSPDSASLDRPWYRKKRYVIPIGVAGALMVIGAFGDDGGPSDTAATSPSPPPATVTVTATATPEPVAEETPTAEATEEPSDSTTEAASESEIPATFLMPNEVGKNLQAAQDDLQAISGNPLFFSDSQDATGADRLQLIDSGWQVCSQKPRAGTELPYDAMNVVFYVVRLSEECP